MSIRAGGAGESIKTPIVLILGGTDKATISEIEMLVREKVHTLIFMG